MSINRYFCSGNLTRDAELHEGGSTPALNISVAVNSDKRNRDTGEWEKVANYVSLVVFGNLAPVIAPKLTKGVKIVAESQLRQRSYEDKNGNKRTATDFVVREIEIMSTGEKFKPEPVADAYAQEDIPF